MQKNLEIMMFAGRRLVLNRQDIVPFNRHPKETVSRAPRPPCPAAQQRATSAERIHTVGLNYRGNCSGCHFRASLVDESGCAVSH